MLVDQQALARYRQSAERAVEWLCAQLKNDGSYQLPVEDLACYYKSPYLFYLSDKGQEANRVLSFIQKTFMRENGDFTTSSELKSENGAFGEYWAYMNGWVALSAQKMGRFEVAFPAYHYLQSFYHPGNGGFTTRKPYGQEDNTVDVFTTAHLGLTALYFGDLEKATAAGRLIQKFHALQPNTQMGFFLRLQGDGGLISTFPKESDIFFVVSTTQPNQAYFMLGYPIAFLGKLYSATDDSQYLETAKQYLEIVLRCQGNLRTFHFSHKVAWGAAIIARITKDIRYAELSMGIADYLLSIQDQNGGWLQDQPAHTCFDLTAEIAIWMKEISCALSEV